MPSLLLGSGNGSNAQALIDAVEAGTLDDHCLYNLRDVKEARIRTGKTTPYSSSFIDCTPSPYALRDQAEATVLQLLEHYQVDYIILAGFMRILKKSLLNALPRKDYQYSPLFIARFSRTRSWTPGI